MKKYLGILLVVMTLFAIGFTAAGCPNGDLPPLFSADPDSFENALAVLVEAADGKPVLIFLSSTN